MRLGKYIPALCHLARFPLTLFLKERESFVIHLGCSPDPDLIQCWEIKPVTKGEESLFRSAFVLPCTS